MTCLRSLSLMLALGVVAACSPAPVNPAKPSPSATTTAPASGAPASAPASSPTPSASAGTPTAAPSAKPSAAAFAWTNGKQLKAYDFKGPGGVYYEFSSNQLYVIDGVDDNTTPRRYLVREFGLDGTFVGAFHLAPSGQNDPDHVDAMAFDRRGIPLYTYRNDYDFLNTSNNTGQSYFGVYQLITAAVVQPTNLPFRPLPRGGVSALASDGDTFTLGYLALDPDKTKDVRRVSYSRCEEDQQPQAIYSFDDPFTPTTLMAASAAGVVYFAGPLPNGGGFTIKSTDVSQKTQDFVKLDELPDGMWTGPKGEVYTAYDETSKAARVRKYLPDGTYAGETSLNLDGGGYLLHVAGLTFDPQGRRIVAGNGVDASNRPIIGIYTFSE